MDFIVYIDLYFPQRNEKVPTSTKHNIMVTCAYHLHILNFLLYQINMDTINLGPPHIEAHPYILIYIYIQYCSFLLDSESIEINSK